MKTCAICKADGIETERPTCPRCGEASFLYVFAAAEDAQSKALPRTRTLPPPKGKA